MEVSGNTLTFTVDSVMLVHNMIYCSPIEIVADDMVLPPEHGKADHKWKNNLALAFSPKTR